MRVSNTFDRADSVSNFHINAVVFLLPFFVVVIIRLDSCVEVE